MNHIIFPNQKMLTSAKKEVVTISLLSFNCLENVHYRPFFPNSPRISMTSLKKKSPVLLFDTLYEPTVNIFIDMYKKKKVNVEVVVFVMALVEAIKLRIPPARTDGRQTLCRNGLGGCCGNHNAHRDHNVYEVSNEHGTYVFCQHCQFMHDIVVSFLNTRVGDINRISNFLRNISARKIEGFPDGDALKDVLYRSVLYFNQYRTGVFSLFGETRLDGNKVTFDGAVDIDLTVVISDEHSGQLDVLGRGRYVVPETVQGLCSTDISNLEQVRTEPKKTIISGTAKCAFGPNCNRRLTCRYVHDDDIMASTAPVCKPVSSKLQKCRDIKNCRFGSKCRFSHDE